MKMESGDTHVIDALTNPLDVERTLNLLTIMGYEFREGRTSLAPEVQCRSILFSAVWCFQHQDFLKQAELRSGILERDCLNRAARVISGDSIYFGLLVGEVLQGRQPGRACAHIACRGF